MQQLIEDIHRYYKQKNRRPVFQLGAHSLFMIISQAPGKKVHDTGIPWNDASGKRLRQWLGVTPEQFYDPRIFSIMPLDFCYPGRGPHGDLPPDPQCAIMWHPRILSAMKHHPLKLLIGSYAIDHYLGTEKKSTMYETICAYRDYWPEYFPMPHPSPRNQNWLKKHPEFERENIPFLRHYIAQQIKEQS